MRAARLSILLGAGLVGAAAIVAGGSDARQGPAPPTGRPPTVAAVSLITTPIPDGPSAAVLRHGRDLVQAGDCVSCHLGEGGAPLAGGLALNTPFGAIYSSNITPDPDTGIGRWTADDFYRAMHDGHGVRGENLYPAFPYPWFRRMSREDDDAVFAYLKTLPATRYTPPDNRLVFPLSFRFLVGFWNLLFLDSKTFEPDPSRSAEWNRGAFLVNGPGHCGACHTPKNAFGADQGGKGFQGGVLDNWTSPDLTANAQTGLGRWTAADVADYLKAGRNPHAGAGGPMADVVTFSTSLISDSDRSAIATYLASIPASPVDAASEPDHASLSRGAAIYSDVCSSCHLENGVGQPGFFAPLGRNSVVQQRDPTGFVHMILAGTRIAATPSRPSPLTMPSFAWKLTDQEVADVATYVRNSWGNQAPAVQPAEVGSLRKKLDLTMPRYTDNSGDQR